MPGELLDSVQISREGNSVTIGDSVKIVVSGQSPTRIKVSRTSEGTDGVHAPSHHRTSQFSFHINSVKTVEMPGRDRSLSFSSGKGIKILFSQKCLHQSLVIIIIYYKSKTKIATTY